MAKRRPIHPMSEKELAALHPGALLGRLQQLQMCEDSPELSDKDSGEIRSDLIQFKDSEAWRAAFADVKTALERHGHIPKSSRPRH